MTHYRGDPKNWVHPDLLHYSRALRRASTDAERRLWQHLRGQQIEGAKFRRQHPFGLYILDFFCAEHNVAIELDG